MGVWFGLYIIGIVTTWYLIHRDNIRQAVKDGKFTTRQESLGGIFWLGIFWPIVALVFGVEWFKDSTRNGYKQYIENLVEQQKSSPIVDDMEVIRIEEERLEGLREEIREEWREYCDERRENGDLGSSLELKNGPLYK